MNMDEACHVMPDCIPRKVNLGSGKSYGDKAGIQQSGPFKMVPKPVVLPVNACRLKSIQLTQCQASDLRLAAHACLVRLDKI